jgi:hypothetical protein
MSAPSKLNPGPVAAPSLLIGTMALGLAVGLDSLGFWQGLDQRTTAWTSALGDGMRDVPARWVLLPTILCAYLLPWLLLKTPLWWRRLVLWVSFLLVTVAWLPVLAMAAWKFPPCMPLVASLWSGLCAMIYAQRQRLPCEMAAATKRTQPEVPLNDS